MSNVIIIADDLTGANDTGVQFCKNGFKTFVAINYSDFNYYDYLDYNVISINANSRILNSQEAYKRVYSIAKKINDTKYDLMYKKIDSVMRGNPGREIEAIMDATGGEIAIVSPSFPANHRVLNRGCLYVDKSNTTINNKQSQKQINVLNVLEKEMKKKVHNIPLETVRKGEQELITQILAYYKKGYQVFLIDSVTDYDMELIVKCSKNLRKKVVLCGSAGLAQHLSKVWDFRTEGNNKYINSNKGVSLLVVGSRNPATSKQVKKVAQVINPPFVKVNIEKIINGESDEVINEIVNQTGELIIDKKSQLIVIVVDSLFKDNDEFMQNLKLDSIDLDAKEIVFVIGEAIKKIYKKYNVNYIIATGGDTSMQICSALQAKGIFLINEIIPGIPSGRLIGGSADGLHIVTKSGGFGSPIALVNVIDYLKRMK